MRKFGLLQEKMMDGRIGRFNMSQETMDAEETCYVEIIPQSSNWMVCVYEGTYIEGETFVAHTSQFPKAMRVAYANNPNKFPIRIVNRDGTEIVLNQWS